MLVATDIEVSYGPIKAVRGVSVHAEQGEIVALLGANGAGKSSLLNAIAGLVPVVAGRVEFGGADVTNLAAEDIVRRGISLTPEGRRVFPRMTVAENLQLGALPQRHRAAAAQALDRVHSLFPVLRERASQHAGTLSGGQQQMLAIGRSLMAGPRLLLLDEPSLGLAPILVDQIFELIATLRSQGTTLIVVEQNAMRSLEIADRAYIFANGVVDAAGDADDLKLSAAVRQAYMREGP